MTDRESVAREVAQKLNFNEFAELLQDTTCWSGRMWDALISSELHNLELAGENKRLREALEEAKCSGE